MLALRSSRFTLMLLTVVGLSAFPLLSNAQDLPAFQRLTQTMQGRQLTPEALGVGGPLTDCSDVAPDRLNELANDGARARTYTQYIVDTMYRWSLIPMSGGLCVYLATPQVKGLSREEARVLLSASKTQFEVPKTANSRPIPVETRNVLSDDKIFVEVANETGRHSSRLAPRRAVAKHLEENTSCPNCGASPMGTVNASVSDERSLLSDPSFPLGTIARVLIGNGTNVKICSAVQLSRYVFQTAAHCVVGTGFQNPTITVFPGWQNPFTVTQRTVVDFSYDLAYTGYSKDTTDPAHDIAFLHISPGFDISDYPKALLINSSLDSASSTTNLGNSAYDPYALGPAVSWYPGDPSGDDMDALPVGYPYSVGGVDNSKQGLPYVDYNGQLSGSVAGYELDYRCSVCLPTVGLSGEVSEGDSGGPIFGWQDGTNNYTLLGTTVGTYSDGTWYAWGAGHFDYNDSWYQNSANWTPGYPITISSPASGATYDAASIPNLVGSAGTYTANLQWYSSVDGYLGAGGTVPVAGLLTAGPQTLIAKLATSASVPYGIMSVDITVTAKPSTLTANPNPVFVPPGSSSASTTLQWSAPSYSLVDIGATANGGPLTTVHSGGTTGTFSYPIHVGYTYTFNLYRRGDTTQVLATTQVVGLPAPVLTASPSPVFIPAGQSRGTTTLTWDATGSGASFVALFVSCNGAAQSIVTGSAAIKGSQGATWMTPGSTCTFNLYPSDNKSNADFSKLLATTNVTGELASPLPTLTVSPKSPIVIPYGSTSTPYSFSWNAPDFSQVDIWGQQNQWMPGQKILLGTVAGSGSANSSMSVGEVATLWVYPHNDQTTVLATVTFNGIGGALLTASPNPVIIPAGATSANFTLAWNAPGNSQVDIYGQQNLYMPGQKLLLGTAATSGSTPASMSVGENATFWVYAHGNTTTALATLNVSGHH